MKIQSENQANLYFPVGTIECIVDVRCKLSAVMRPAVTQ